MQIQLNIIQNSFGVNSKLSIPDFNYTVKLEEVPEIPEYIPKAFPIERAQKIV